MGNTPKKPMIGDGGMSADVMAERKLNTDTPKAKKELDRSKTYELMWLDLSDTCHTLDQRLDQSVQAYILTSELYEPPCTE